MGKSNTIPGTINTHKRGGGGGKKTDPGVAAAARAGVALAGVATAATAVAAAATAGAAAAACAEDPSAAGDLPKLAGTDATEDRVAGREVVDEAVEVGLPHMMGVQPVDADPAGVGAGESVPVAGVLVAAAVAAAGAAAAGFAPHEMGFFARLDAAGIGAAVGEGVALPPNNFARSFTDL